MTKIFSIIILVLGCVSAQSQTKGTDRFKSLSETHLSPYDSIPFRCVGPTVMSGRVVDIAWDPQNDHHFYVAYASGGLWETTNNGTSFHPIMDHLQAMTIGAIAVDWKNQKIWVGTGENNSSRSSYSGVGIYCTTNNGQTWTYKGLPESHHIGKIILHPSDPNKIWIGVLGHLYTPNSERGIYFSENGGESWTQQLFIDENTGCIDLEINPSDPTELFAAMWQRSRRAWNFEDGGKNSGVYHSKDGGKTWKKINTAPFPDNEGTGRIGLAFTSDGKNKYLYASIDNQNRRPEKPSERSVIKKNDFEKMTKEQFLALDSTQFASFLKEQYFPEALSRDSLRTLVNLDKIAPSAIYDYLYDANEDLFNSPVVSLEVYQFNFENNSWKKTHEDFLDDVVYSYGYYFGVMEVDPSNPQKIYSAGVPIITSDDGGKTWYGINPANVHVDHHVIKIHPKNSNYIINGSDGGVQISYDGGKTFVNCNTPAVGQFYSVQVDQRSPYNVYGGLQDNGVWYGSSTNTPNRNWTYEGQYPFKNIMGGDGMQVQIDPRNNDIVYTGYQFGYYSRINLANNEYVDFHPEHTLGERPLRFNWQTPILLSSHNADILYMCSNKVHRSMDRGDHFIAISSDLTKGPKAGDVPFGTLTTIDESKLQFGWIVVGADDGSVHITKNGGETWTDISKGLPVKYVSRVIFSKHKKETIWVALNGYREDDFTAYLFVSDDAGKTWTNAGKTLPMSPINVVREDATDPHIIYVGTDDGLFVSNDIGKTFYAFGKLPHVPIHDLVIQEQAEEIVIGTHGRSIWIGDVRAIRSDIPNRNASFHIVLENEYAYANPGKKRTNWFNETTPEIEFMFRSDKAIEAQLLYQDSTVINTITLPSTNGKWMKLTLPRKLDKEKCVDLIDKAEGFKLSDDKELYLPEGQYTILIADKRYEFGVKR